MTRIQSVVCGSIMWAIPLAALAGQQVPPQPAPKPVPQPAAKPVPQPAPIPTVTLPAAQASRATPAQDVFSYSYLQVNRLSEQSYSFGSRSAGNGLRFSYDFPNQVYVFGEWNHLNFAKLPGSHDVTGVGIGAHQQYSSSTSFYVNLSLLRDRLSSNLYGGARDYYWRLSYGFQSHLSSFVGLTAAILTERNTDFGRRPFGERVGLIFGGRMLALTVSAEHTNNGNRLEAAFDWYYK